MFPVLDGSVTCLPRAAVPFTIILLLVVSITVFLRVVLKETFASMASDVRVHIQPVGVCFVTVCVCVSPKDATGIFLPISHFW